MSLPAGASMAALVSSVRIQFQHCTTNPQLIAGDWAELRLSDFNLWVAGVGATARNKASLDARLQALPEERATLQHILSSLHKSLIDCQRLRGSELYASRQIVDVIIENLAILANVIRRTGRESRLRRADADFDPDRQADFRRHLECIVLLRPSKDGVQDFHRTSNSCLASQCRLTEIQSRLIDANMRRRYRFLRAQRHALKLAEQSQLTLRVGNEPHNPTFESHTVKSPGGGEQPYSQTGGHKTGSKQRDRCHTESVAAPQLEPSTGAARSSTKASTVNLDPNLFAEGGKSRPVPAPEIALTTITTIAAAIEYPKPPKLSHSGPERPMIMKCPCCCQALPSNTSDGDWKKHLAGDLYPYTCIAEACPTPHVLYLTRRDLEKHMNTDHPPSRWGCPICSDTNTIFCELEAMVNHLQGEHADTLPAGTIEAAISWGAIKSYGITSCPLCDSSGALDDPELVSHVLKHTHDFALRALPWPKLAALTSEPAGKYNPSHAASDTVAEWLSSVVNEKVVCESALANLSLRPCDKQVIDLVEDCGGSDYFAKNPYFSEVLEESHTWSTSKSLPESVPESIVLATPQETLFAIGQPWDDLSGMERWSEEIALPSADEVFGPSIIIESQNEPNQIGIRIWALRNSGFPSPTELPMRSIGSSERGSDGIDSSSDDNSE
ncbi:hypothetical protein B0T14DRAFT_512967 [Immersiella caudata]|uniref:C2H2-type domain-containing protein n=1 Tax=Immersiella caudata TaxID=314043 RepID=A0AA39X6B7_9PEZI|nr:hypothetical protein B0T14DRAFT_512967 [Immersiella caudata]